MSDTSVIVYAYNRASMIRDRVAVVLAQKGGAFESSAVVADSFGLRVALSGKGMQ